MAWQATEATDEYLTAFVAASIPVGRLAPAGARVARASRVVVVIGVVSDCTRSQVRMTNALATSPICSPASNR